MKPKFWLKSQKGNWYHTEPGWRITIFFSARHDGWKFVTQIDDDPPEWSEDVYRSPEEALPPLIRVTDGVPETFDE